MVHEVLPTLHDVVVKSTPRTRRLASDGAIAVAVPDVGPHFASVLTGIAGAAARVGRPLVVTTFGTRADGEREAVDILLRSGIAGLIVAPASADQSHLGSHPVQVPVVFVDRPPRGISGDYVVNDDTAGARDAVRHLVAHGHRRVAFIGDGASEHASRLRHDGFELQVAKTRPELDPQPPLLRTAGSRWVDDALAALDAPGGPTAIVSSSPACTVELLVAMGPARRAGVAVVGFGDFPLAALLDQPLTFVDLAPARLGELAAAHLLERVRDPSAVLPARTVLPLLLVARGSGELPPGAD